LFIANSDYFALAYYAVMRIGGIVVPLDIRFRGTELRDVLTQVEPKILVVSDSTLELVSPLLEELHLLKHIFVAGKKVPSGCIPLDEGLNFASHQDIVVPVDPQDDCLYLYTSGSTGTPKGVVLCYHHLDYFPEGLNNMINIPPDYVALMPLPMSHLSGPLCCNFLLTNGVPMVIVDRIRPDTLLSAIEKYKVRWFWAVPPIVAMLVQTKDREKYDVSSLRIVAMMGMTVPVSLMEAFEKICPEVMVVQGYGLTETSPLITLPDIDRLKEKMGSIGKAVPRIEIKIVDDRGNEVPKGNIGELIVRGPQVMKSYYKRPDLTAKVMRNGWFHTGDMARVDEDGYYYHMGRKDDMIITGGLNVFPAEIESVLHKHPHVAEAAVVGVPNSLRGTTIKAAVVLTRGSNMSKRQLRNFCQKHLATYKVPQQFAIMESLPKTGTGKVFKEALKGSMSE
jgi:long-chain acyl-CoA synthetase